MSDIVKFQENDVFSLGRVFAASGYFQDARDAAQATVKILAGRELGLPPFASMTGIHIIKGKPAMGANLIAARIKSSGKYTYRVLEMSDQACRIAFFEDSEQIGISEFTLADARKAGTQNLDKFPRNMLFARAISNGAKWFCPDLFITGVYVPEEMGAKVDAEGDVIALPAPEPPRATYTPQAPAQKPINRDVALARIAELGGDAENAASLSDADLVAYGKSLREQINKVKTDVATSTQQDSPVQGAPAKVSGYVDAANAYVSDKVCKFDVGNGDDLTTVVIFPQRTVWNLFVNHEGAFTADSEDYVHVVGKWSIKDGYDPSVVADEITFGGNDEN